MGKTVRKESLEEFDDFIENSNHRGAKARVIAKKKNTLKNPHRNVQFSENDVYYDINAYKDYYTKH